MLEGGSPLSGKGRFVLLDEWTLAGQVRKENSSFSQKYHGFVRNFLNFGATFSHSYYSLERNFLAF